MVMRLLILLVWVLMCKWGQLVDYYFSFYVETGGVCDFVRWLKWKLARVVHHSFGNSPA